MSRKIVIIGGVAGGASAAARLRRLNEQDEIIMFERGEHVSFANCGLPYYIGGTIAEREKLFVQTPEGIKARFNIDVRVKTEVTEILRDRKMIRYRSVETGETGEMSYDFAILSPGAKPIVPEIPGIGAAQNLYTLRNIADTDRIKSAVDGLKSGHATILGAGFIGLEMAENLRERGLDVTVIDRGGQILGPLDPEMAAPVEAHMRLHGVDLRLNEGVEAIEDGGKTLALASGAILRTDLIIMSIGVTPENELARAAGLELGVRGAVKVNHALQTSDPAIYAVGDAIEVKDYNLGYETMVSLAWGANRQGRLAADHINGREISYEGALGTAIIKTFGLTSALTGNNEKTLRARGIPYEAVHIHPNSHAGYYPGASPLAIKLLFSPKDGTLFGAQAVGPDGADKRIDVISAAIRGKLTASELADIELAYAPPYSSAKDPVNLAGYAAGNVLEGLVRNLQWYEVDNFVAGGGLVIDVRDEVERLAGSIPGSVNIPLAQLRDRLDELPGDREFAVSCQVGLRGYIAARMLMQHGYNVKNVDGGYKTYSAMAAKRNNDTDQGRQDPVQPLKEQAAPSAPASFSEESRIRPSKPAPDRYAQIEPPAAASATASPLLLDACGLQCPGPILKVYETVQTMEEGERLAITATDFGFAADIRQWCLKTGNTLEAVDLTAGKVQAVVRKGNAEIPAAASGSSAAPKDGTTLIVFSGDLDKTIASFIIASGAAAMGKEVTMFFTFWGLNVLRKDKRRAPKVKKPAMDKMFAAMMPQGTLGLPLSKMNMGGLGAKMIRYAMKRKNVNSLEQLMQGALKVGVKLIACTMSMDIMGISREELIDGVEFGGVAAYLGAAEDSTVNLFT
ncbi:DsrE/DsrF/DrsH-like family protein [Paenibacillus sp. NFR01]|uniref:DsrE/DsrF/DrsH-like family protein n=1 Tax=Paenibacillus sp. NFR01 TaxID=1566279 RepID=UPI0008B11885|nr:DsrE/DsrF/DrsH-like family protein [Paenibacillus sp. NFR01]SET00275.1 NADPH-dependent 2,4-dienoyl-CoA reductase, sulfur reductase [Paenibacillus sp. NFR01]